MISSALSAASNKLLVLAILSRREKSYGYEIIQLVRAASDDQLEWKDGMLYPVLHRMEKEALIASSWGLSESGRKRKYYRILPKGRSALDAEYKDWLSVHQTILALWKPSTELGLSPS